MTKKQALSEKAKLIAKINVLDRVIENVKLPKGYTRHTGLERPVGYETVVSLFLRSGSKITMPAYQPMWTGKTAIVGYKVISNPYQDLEQAIANGDTVFFNKSESITLPHIWQYPRDKYTIKPWKLPKLPVGFSWHKGEKAWTKECLKGGYRPLIYDEKIEEGDEFWSIFGNTWNRSNMFGHTACNFLMKLRTKRPLPVFEERVTIERRVGTNEWQVISQKAALL